MKDTLHFSGLNGLRAMAALAVLFSHLTQALHEFGLDPFVFGRYPDGAPKTTLLAGFGISMFFTLSGFLITYLLLAEKQKRDIYVNNFYARRILRIWPLYFLYLGASLATIAIFNIYIDKSLILYYLFMMPNIPFILGTPVGLIGHYWTLGVEEQFYAFWPWIVKRKQSILKVTIFLCIALIMLKVIFRIVDIQIHNGDMSWPYIALHVTRFHCMLIGAIGAILFFQKNTLFIYLTNNMLIQFISWSVIFLVIINKFHIMSVLDNEIISLFTVILIIGQIEKTNRIINLDNVVFNFIGKISYGIYVLHPLIIFYLSQVMHFENRGSGFNYTLVYVVVFSATLILAYLSYTFIESKFLKLKERYSTIRSSDT